MLKGLQFFGVVGCLAASLLASQSGWAKGKAKPKSDDDDSGYKVRYGMAGCGLGSLIVDADTKMQIFAVTSNLTGFQTSAISCSHSSNCQPDPAMAAMEQKVFISANMRALEADVAQGGGDYSYAFAQVLGCDGVDNYEEFLTVSRDHFGGIFGSSDPQVVYNRYVEALRASPKLVKGCERMLRT